MSQTWHPDDIELLCLLYAGLDQDRIARALYASRSTVQRRIRRLMNQLEVSGMVALGAEAARRGLLPGDVSAPPGGGLPAPDRATRAARAADPRGEKVDG